MKQSDSLNRRLLLDCFNFGVEAEVIIILPHAEFPAADLTDCLIFHRTRLMRVQNYSKQ